ncbi:unnamed protein product [Brassica rapa subsp. narinosa]
MSFVHSLLTLICFQIPAGLGALIFIKWISLNGFLITIFKKRLNGFH